jgi:hypothetical protein
MHSLKKLLHRDAIRQASEFLPVHDALGKVIPVQFRRAVSEVWHFTPRLGGETTAQHGIKPVSVLDSTDFDA